ncbi:hypothetical protein HLH26_19860 [Gluconacetobacter sp. 1b LMG 1731]|uniref:Uncharacterized protein n=1 Tax=Gluconacetobacter dulcium TaxID=2729096 RepID=A0A7W4IPJ6_9PROT|nr:hypothetical protein [Gluconacetobacter dulcium]MBB2166730.1 hypothetical protein [Gluconacetobacter dulcium]MBB2195832.1 hypothetical protein [Gluconacetobacter dulcium]
MSYAALTAQGLIALIQDIPAIADSIKALLAPIQERRAPTEAEWEAAKARVGEANQAVQAGQQLTWASIPK